MTVVAQTEVTRETYWGISATEYAVFYLLAAITIFVFLYGVYRRFDRYAAGDDDPFARLDDLSTRVVEAARIALSNEKNFNRDLYGGLMHSFILWGFLTLLIATLIIMFEQYATEMLFDVAFWHGDFYLAYQFIVDAMGLLFVVGIGMAI
ncbi:Fe-S oxidoreductase, partial [Natrarchaeobius oligotrophus]